MNPVKAIAALVVAMASYACVGPFSELQENQYANAVAARAADPSGWIPAILPGDAARIREVHNVDSTRTWGCFGTRTMKEVRGLLRQLHARESRGPIGSRPADRDFGWWPQSMNSAAWKRGSSPSRPSALCAAPLAFALVSTPQGRWCASTGRNGDDGAAEQGVRVTKPGELPASQLMRTVMRTR